MPLRLTIPLVLLGCATAAPKTDSPTAAAATPDSIIAAPDRSEADRALDPGRKPASLLQFLGLKPGMHVAELVAGGGYSTELMARAVAPTGVVYAENPKGTLQRFAEKPFSARLATPPMHNVVRVDRELDDPFPPEVQNLDLVLSFVVYHDGVWQGVDRPQMNAAVFRALRTGGIYAICDSSAKEGHGVQDVQTLHRIDESTVVSEVTEAGFRLAGKDDFLRNPDDTRDWNSSPKESGARRGTSDRFVLKFVRPR